MYQWAPSKQIHQPSAHPIDHTVLPGLLATRRVPAAGCYLSVRARDFCRLDWGDFHVWCVLESPLPSLSLSVSLLLPPFCFTGAVVVWRAGAALLSKRIGSHFCLLSTQRRRLFDRGETWKSGIIETDHWLCCNKRKFWGTCWKTTGQRQNRHSKKKKLWQEVRLDKRGEQWTHFVNGSKKIGVAQWKSEPDILACATESLVQERQRGLWQWTFSTLHSHQRATSIIHHSFSVQRLSTAG